MSELFKTNKYGAIKTTDNSTMGYYAVKFMSESYPLQYKCKNNGQISEYGDLVVKAQYMDCIKVNTNWYWEQSTKYNTIIIPTCTIFHPSLDLVIIKYFK